MRGFAAQFPPPHPKIVPTALVEGRGRISQADPTRGINMGSYVLVQMLRGRIVQINDKSMKIGIQGNFGMLISNQSGPTLDFSQESSNLQSKMADIENVNVSYNFK